MRPLIYIASVRRTGSTMLAELLSDPPRCFVFREPRLVMGRLRLKPGPATVLNPLGVDVESLSREMREQEPDDAVRTFRAFCEANSERIRQFGVKEIRHEGWERVSATFPDMRVVVTARDPRDIYLSMWHKREAIERRSREWTDPDVLAEDINQEFERLREMMRHHPHLTVRYEDLCLDPAAIDRVRTFLGCETEGIGLLGHTSSGNFERHGSAVGASRVEVWRQEAAGEGLDNAHRAFEAMAEYAEFWGYR